ncbi:MAG: sugar ABC transporter permease [Acidimicrobiia bacterium]|nr:sugar ABC transporter permease [Acidimicrobiia bacterium]
MAELDVDVETTSDVPPGRGPGRKPNEFLLVPLRIAAALVVPVVAFAVLWWTFDFLKDEDANRVIVVVVALVVGVFGVFALYYAMDRLTNQLPEGVADKVRPFVFVGPALVILTVFLVYPAVNTLILSFQDASSETFVGLDNFQTIFTDSGTLEAVRNSAMWVVIVPFFSVSIGLSFATLADKLGRRQEAISKSFIFLPMAISFVGASIVWRFIYNFRPEGFGEQIGLLNGIWSGLGNTPVSWLLQEPWNNFMLMVIMIWLQTGFAMVILSSAIKSVPDDIIEAARIDGASEMQVFWKVTFPSISSTLVVVGTTIVITTWKLFDIVFVMTGGQFGTSVTAERMVTEFFTFRNNGVGAALAVLLFMAVIPLMVLNIRRFKEQELTR